LSEDEKELEVQQLRGYFNQLRQIKGTFIGSIDGTEFEDQLFPDEVRGWGPYKDEPGFNQGLIKAWMRRYSGDPFICMLCRMLEGIGKGHEIVLTHNDFAARNILVQESKVVAILDWELTGFHPESWEYCKALWRPEWDGLWIKEGLVDRVLPQYLKEDHHRRRCHHLQHQGFASQASTKMTHRQPAISEPCRQQTRASREEEMIQLRSASFRF
jgi:hypothetical protein